MTAANAFGRQCATGKSSAQADRVNRVSRTRRRETATGGRAEQKYLRGRNDPAINANGKNQNVLERIHDLIFQQACAVQCRQKILFDFGEIASGNRRPRDKDEFDRLHQFMLMQPETFAEQASRATAFNRAADAFARDNAQFRLRSVGQLIPIGDEAAKREALTLLPHAREIAALLKPHGAAQPQAFRRFSKHDD
jgi:hypothetical protein